MKGLLIKDFYLLKQVKKSMLVFVLIAVFMLFANKGDSSFIISYTTVMMAMLGISTIGYDEHNDGMTFLMTLPVTRKIYVYEKYLYCVGMCALGCIIAMIITLAGALIWNRSITITDMAILSLVSFLIGIFMLIPMLPVQLKFGSEKGRIGILVVFFTLFAAGYAVVRVLQMIKVDIISVLNQVVSHSYSWVIAVVVIMFLYFISIRISMHIMEKKQY